jgi:hypothetical protein
VRRLAALVSEYRPHSHADVIVGRYLSGYYFDGKHHSPGSQIVRMYTDQVPDHDMSRDLAREHGFGLVPSIRHALTGIADESMGARSLEVDGILLICEHGAYPYNPLGQKLYPRYEFFKQVIDVFRETGQTVPVFFDKHYSVEWWKARWMVDQARDLGFPLMAGSVIPLGRHPDCRWLKGRPISKAIGIWNADFSDSKESYGFHALENLQGMVEQRSEVETGIAAVQCLEGDSAWAWTDQHPWSQQLLASICVSDPRACPDPLLFVLEYADGLEAVIYRLNEVETQSDFAALVPGESEPVVVPTTSDTPRPVHLPDEVRDRYPVANHFAAEVHLIEQMLDTGLEPHAAERTLLTTGTLVALHESSYQPAPNYGRTMQHGRHLTEGMRIVTDHLQIEYRPT